MEKTIYATAATVLVILALMVGVNVNTYKGYNLPAGLTVCSTPDAFEMLVKSMSGKGDIMQLLTFGTMADQMMKSGACSTLKETITAQGRIYSDAAMEFRLSNGELVYSLNPKHMRKPINLPASPNSNG